MQRAVSWFEIAVRDLDRATRFYEQVLGAPLKREVFFGTPLAVFPYELPATGGALIPAAPEHAPGGSSSVVYLSAEGKLDECIGRVAKAGGEVVQPRTAIGPAGFIALIRDSEGNTVGLHSQSA
jgi:predicted enzyme related to lactoylglutathione lyase